MSKEPTEFGDVRRQIPREMPGWMRKKIATAEFANAIIMTRLQNSPQVQYGPKAAEALVQEAFIIAEAFDKHMETYLQPPTIEAPPAGFRP